MKKWISAAVVAAVLPLSALADTKIGVAMAQFDDNFLTLIRNGMAARGKEVKGVSLQFEDARGDVGRQLSQVESFVAQKVNAIIVSPADTAATKRISDAARKAGIPLVYVNRLPEEKLGNGVGFVGSDNKVAGQIQAEALAKRLNGKGNVVVMLGQLSTDAAEARTAGVKEVFKKYPGIKVVEEQTANWQRTQGIDLMSKWISAGVKVDAVAANNDEMAIGALIALRQAKISPQKVLVAGVDATPDAMSELAKGDLALTVFQNAKGQAAGAVDLVLRMARGDKAAPTSVLIPFELVTKDNMKQYATN